MSDATEPEMDLYLTYRPNGGQVFMFPMMAVFAPSLEAARVIAGPDRNNGHDYLALARDSAGAQVRLGLAGRPDKLKQVMRGNS